MEKPSAGMENPLGQTVVFIERGEAEPSGPVKNPSFQDRTLDTERRSDPSSIYIAIWIPACIFKSVPVSVP